MKHKSLYNAFSFFMAFAVLFSTLSFTVESHYCGSRLVDTAVFTKVKSCGIETATKTLLKAGCCNDKVDVVKGQDELKLNSFDTLDFGQQVILGSFVLAYISFFESLPKQTIPHKEYSPPSLVFDITILDETFLI